MARDELNDRMDFSALDPFSDPAERDAFVARVLDRSALELARRRRKGAGELAWSGVSVFGVMAGWLRPALAAAALAVVASGFALRLTRPEPQPSEQAGVIEALALPTPVEEWVSEERTPSTADMILTLEGGTAW
jgi:hypothetical protein